jgi:hypothetical protein
MSLLPTVIDALEQVVRFVSNIHWMNYFFHEPFQISSLSVTPFPVMHGEDLQSSGFLITGNDSSCPSSSSSAQSVAKSRPRAKLCYISDISRMLPSSLLFLQSLRTPHTESHTDKDPHSSAPTNTSSSFSGIDLLVVDALAMSYEHPTHFSVSQAIELCRQLRPQRCLLVGMGSEIEYEEVNRELRKYLDTEGMDIQLAHDGLVVDIDL